MVSDPFASAPVSLFLAWAAFVPMILGLLFQVPAMLDALAEMPRRLAVWMLWILLCLFVFSPLRYILFQIVWATSYLFQSWLAVLNSLMLATFVPLIYGVLYAIGLGVPLFLVALVSGLNEEPTRARLWLAGIAAPLIFMIFSRLFFAVLPYAAYSTRWLNPTDVIRATNGPSYYVFRYGVERFTPLHFSPFFTEVVGIENMDSTARLRAHVATVYLSRRAFSYFVAETYPAQFEQLLRDLGP